MCVWPRSFCLLTFWVSVLFCVSVSWRVKCFLFPSSVVYLGEIKLATSGPLYSWFALSSLILLHKLQFNLYFNNCSVKEGKSALIWFAWMIRAYIFRPQSASECVFVCVSSSLYVPWTRQKVFSWMHLLLIEFGLASHAWEGANCTDVYSSCALNEWLTGERERARARERERETLIEMLALSLSV